MTGVREVGKVAIASSCAWKLRVEIQKLGPAVQCTEAVHYISRGCVWKWSCGSRLFRLSDKNVRWKFTSKASAEEEVVSMKGGGQVKINTVYYLRLYTSKWNVPLHDHHYAHQAYLSNAVSA